MHFQHPTRDINQAKDQVDEPTSPPRWRRRQPSKFVQRIYSAGRSIRQLSCFTRQFFAGESERFLRTGPGRKKRARDPARSTPLGFIKRPSTPGKKRNIRAAQSVSPVSQRGFTTVAFMVSHFFPLLPLISCIPRSLSPFPGRRTPPFNRESLVLS